MKLLVRNKFSIAVALVILYLSLANSHTFDKVSFLEFKYTDKVVHFAMYFGLMAVIIIENRIKMMALKKVLIIASIPLAYGILMEILQALLTTTRSCSIYDVFADLSGIIVAAIIWMLIRSKFSEGTVR